MLIPLCVLVSAAFCATLLVCSLQPLHHVRVVELSSPQLGVLVSTSSQGDKSSCQSRERNDEQECLRQDLLLGVMLSPGETSARANLRGQTTMVHYLDVVLPLDVYSSVVPVRRPSIFHERNCYFLSVYVIVRSSVFARTLTISTITFMSSSTLPSCHPLPSSSLRARFSYLTPEGTLLLPIHNTVANDRKLWIETCGSSTVCYKACRCHFFPTVMLISPLQQSITMALLCNLVFRGVGDAKKSPPVPVKVSHAPRPFHHFHPQSPGGIPSSPIVRPHAIPRSYPCKNRRLPSVAL